MELIDTHIHLDFDQYDPDRKELFARAHAASVNRMITIGAGGGIASTLRAISLAEENQFVWASVGVHPHDAGHEISLKEIRSLAAHPKVVAIGETGLDFFRDWSPIDRQREWFKAQIDISKELSKPLIIHSREAGEEAIATLIREGADAVGGVFHCYSEDAAFAKRLMEINFLISITGTVTFKKADKLRNIVKEIPLEQIMVETDGPYMAPEPYRGARSESAHVVEIARTIASIKEISFEEVCRVTTENAERLFRFKK